MGSSKPSAAPTSTGPTFTSAPTGRFRALACFMFVIMHSCCISTHADSLHATPATAAVEKTSKDTNQNHSSTPGVSGVHTVHVVSSCHLDVGFAGTPSQILNRYFGDPVHNVDGFLVSAAKTAHALSVDNATGPQLIFMTHSYLVSLFLDCPPGLNLNCPTEEAKAWVKGALVNGSLVMHAFPFNSELATLEASLFTAGVEVTHALQDELGVARSTVLSQRDVPGMPRSAVPLLVSKGVTAVTVGVNTASLPPHVPRVFEWHDNVSNESLIALWHPHGYGGIAVQDCVVLKGFGHALCPVWRGDNSGPPPAEEVHANFAILQKEFPSATIQASTYDIFVKELQDNYADVQLPVVSGEIGDNWIFGVPSDPYKIAAFRAAQRARIQVMETRRQQKYDSVDDKVALAESNFTRQFLKGSEHTWGMDVKTYLHDTTNWANSKFNAVVNSSTNFIDMVKDWRIQREWALEHPLEALPLNSLLRQSIEAEVAKVKPSSVPPSTDGYVEVPSSQWSNTFTLGGGFELLLNVSTGAVQTLEKPGNLIFDNKAKARTTAKSEGGEPILSLLYQTFTTADYQTFFDQYAQRIDGKIPGYFPKDFGKPGMDAAAPKRMDIATSLEHVYYNKKVASLLLALSLDDDAGEAHADYGAPQIVWMELAGDVSGLDVTLLAVNKTSTRLPEAMWLTFNPAVDFKSGSGGRWSMNKLGEDIDALAVVTNGSAHLHAVWDGVKYTSAGTDSAMQSEYSYKLRTLDAPVISWGRPTPFPTPNGKPDLSEGVSVCLWQNIWGTNYIMWYPFLPGDEHIQYRFTIEMS